VARNAQLLRLLEAQRAMENEDRLASMGASRADRATEGVPLLELDEFPGDVAPVLDQRKTKTFR
jgi:hypothetical protein